MNIFRQWKLMLLLGVIGVIALVGAGIAWGEKARGAVDWFENRITTSPDRANDKLNEIGSFFADMGDWIMGRNEMSPLVVMLITLVAVIIGAVLVKVNALSYILKGVKKFAEFAGWVITMLPSRRAIAFTFIGISVLFGAIIGGTYVAVALGDQKQMVLSWGDEIKSIGNVFDEEPKKATSEDKKVEAAPKGEPTADAQQSAPAEDDPTSEPTPASSASASEKATPKGEPATKSAATEKKADADKSVMERTNDWANSPVKVTNLVAVLAGMLMLMLVLVIGVLVLRQRAIDRELAKMKRDIRYSKSSLGSRD